MCVCVCVWMSVCVSNLRCPEPEVVSPRLLYYLEEICQASCTNCFSRLYETCFTRKGFGSFSRGKRRIPLHVPLQFRLLWAAWILPTSWPLLNHSRKSHVEGHAHYIMGNVCMCTGLCLKRDVSIVSFPSIWLALRFNKLNDNEWTITRKWSR